MSSPVMTVVVLVAGGWLGSRVGISSVGVTVYSWFISGCLVRERPVPGQKHQGEDLIET